MNSKHKLLLEKLFNTCNLIGENVDIYKQINKIKDFKNLSEEEKDKIYDYIAERMAL
jgi:hypothetical protein